MIDAVILCGGQGTRLLPVWKGPKCLAPVLDRPFLSILLDQLAEACFSRVVLCTGVGAGQVLETMGRKYKGMELVYSQECKPLGTGGALTNAAKKIETERFLVMNGDSYIHYPLGMFCDHDSTEASMMAVYQPSVYKMRVVEFKNDKVRSYGLRDTGSHQSGWVSCGVYLLHIDHLPVSTPRDAKPWSLEDELLPRIVKSGQMNGLGVRRPFIDIGTPNSYEIADSFFQQLKHVPAETMRER